MNFCMTWQKKRNIGSKEVIEIMKNAFKMLFDDLKKNEIPEKTSADLSKMVEQMLSCEIDLWFKI